MPLRHLQHRSQPQQPPNRYLFNRFATFGTGAQNIMQYGEVFKTLVLGEVELLEYDNVQFLLELECAYSTRFELPFLKGSHQMGVVPSEDYETWYTSYMQAIRRRSNCPTEFFPRFPYLSAHHQIWVRLYIHCLADVFQKHKLNIRALTRINPVNRFDETMFRYTRARLAENERFWKINAFG